MVASHAFYLGSKASSKQLMNQRLRFEFVRELLGVSEARKNDCLKESRNELVSIFLPSNFIHFPKPLDFLMELYWVQNSFPPGSNVLSSEHLKDAKSAVRSKRATVAVELFHRVVS